MGAEIPLTLAYKLNSVCNAGFWPAVQNIGLYPIREAHKNQLQGKFNTIYSVSQVSLSTYSILIVPSYLSENKKWESAEFNPFRPYI